VLPASQGVVGHMLHLVEVDYGWEDAVEADGRGCHMAIRRLGWFFCRGTTGPRRMSQLQPG